MTMDFVRRRDEYGEITEAHIRCVEQQVSRVTFDLCRR